MTATPTIRDCKHERRTLHGQCLDCHALPYEQRPGLMFAADGRTIIGEKAISDRDFLAPLLKGDTT